MWGDGDPPDNAVTDFWNHINSENYPRLEKLQYSVLGLGDKNYLPLFVPWEKSSIKDLKNSEPKDSHQEENVMSTTRKPQEDWFNGVLNKLDTSIKKETTKTNTSGYSKRILSCKSNS